MRPSDTPRSVDAANPPLPDQTAATSVLLDANGVVVSGTADTAWLLGRRLDIPATDDGAPHIGTVVLHSPQGPAEYRYTASPLLAGKESRAACLVTLTRSDIPSWEEAHRRGTRHARLARDAAARVSASLDFREIADALVRVLVPDFADVATVDVPEAVLRTDEAPTRALAESRLYRAALATADGRTRGLTPAGHVLPTLPAPPDLEPPPPGTALVMTDMAQLRRALGLPDAELRGMMPRDAHALITAPMVGGDRTLGVLAAWRTTTPGSFDADEADLFEEIASRGSLALDNARRYAREHRTAVALQRSLLPSAMPRVAAAATAGTYVPARGDIGVGGDWYDAVPLSSLRTAFVVGDVAGHGLGASAAMGRLRAAVRTMADLDPDPGELLAHLDDLTVVGAIGGRAFDEDGTEAPDRGLESGGADVSATAHGATALYAVYDPIAGTCTMASAGHPPPVVLRPGQAPEFVDLSPGPPLGFGGLPFEETEIAVPPGTLLALYTDGLVDRRTPHPGDGTAALAAALDEHRDDPLDRIGPALLDRLAPPNTDDVALLLVRTARVPADSVAEWELPADPSVVAQARELATARLASWGLEELAFGTELVVSELVTNAIRYGGAPVGLRLIRGDAVICEVSDPSNTQPRLRRAHEDDEGGRGLYLVAQLTSRWGSRYRRSGKTIWTEQHIGGDRAG